NPALASGSPCSGGACDGASLCVECVSDAQCSGSRPFCDTSANACVECLSGSHCGDGNECTSDVCSAGVCANPALASGSPCSGGACDGASLCVECVSDAQ